MKAVVWFLFSVFALLSWFGYGVLVLLAFAVGLVASVGLVVVMLARVVAMMFVEVRAMARRRWEVLCRGL